MKGYFKNLKRIQEDLGYPNIFYVGDIFHTPREPAELVNFLIEYMPRGYAIPGQHDLPYHRYNDKDKSPYWTLVKAHVILDLDPERNFHPVYPSCDDGRKFIPLLIKAFPWEVDIEPFYEVPKDEYADCLKVCLAHSYIWREGKSYQDAPTDQRVSAYNRKLKGYDVAFFGDNHLPFSVDTKPHIVNCGAFYSGKIDEKGMFRYVWALYNTGRVSCINMDTSKDQWLDKQMALTSEAIIMTDEVVEAMEGLQQTIIDFQTVLFRNMDALDVRKGVKTIIHDSLPKEK